jgi:hypothetical protein
MLSPIHCMTDEAPAALVKTLIYLRQLLVIKTWVFSWRYGIVSLE